MSPYHSVSANQQVIFFLLFFSPSGKEALNGKITADKPQK